MDAESFPYTDNRQQTDRHARLDKGEAAYGVALKTIVCYVHTLVERHNNLLTVTVT